MGKLPKLMVETPEFLVRYVLFSGDNLVVVEGQIVYSYDDFVTLCSQEAHKDKEYLKIEIFPVMEGG